ncbi:MAG: MltA domain-containing protein [Desulfosalsimonadaceae bacterium]
MKTGSNPMAAFVLVFLFSVFHLFACPVAAESSTAGIEKIPAEHWPSFEDDEDLRLLAEAVSESIAYYERLPEDRVFTYGRERYAAETLAAGLRRFRAFLKTRPEPAAFNEFIRENGSLYAYRENSRQLEVLFTGYYEPMIPGSLKSCGKFRYPVYSRPDDLVTIDSSAFALKCSPKTLIGRIAGKKVVPYFNRSEIDAGVLEEKASPIAWVNDPVALFFLHVQGSGKILLEDGRHINLHYDISNGLPYKSIGKYLIDKGKIAAADMSMQKIAQYIRNNPREEKEILRYNPRYIFFREGENGVRGCLDAPLTGGRSVALDQEASPPGALLYIKSSKPVCDGSGDIEKWVDFSRFALNQDTGSAIAGPQRADLFWGSGDYAETAAGYMKHPGRVYFLVIHPEDEP